MAYRKMEPKLVVEVVHRATQGESLRAIARATGLDRKSVRRYLAVARALHLDVGWLLDDEVAAVLTHTVGRRQRGVTEKQHALAQRAERIRGWLAQRVPFMKIVELLAAEGVDVSYATLRRFAVTNLAWRRRAPASRAAPAARAA